MIHKYKIGMGILSSWQSCHIGSLAFGLAHPSPNQIDIIFISNLMDSWVALYPLFKLQV